MIILNWGFSCSCVNILNLIYSEIIIMILKGWPVSQSVNILLKKIAYINIFPLVLWLNQKIKYEKISYLFLFTVKYIKLHNFIQFLQLIE